MLLKDGEIVYGEWLPDQPVLGNPGLVEAKNCIPIDTFYKDFAGIVASTSALAAAPIGAFTAVDDSGDPDTYAGTLTAIYQKTGSTWADRSSAAYTTVSANRWHFTQFDTYVIATNYDDVPQRKIAGSGANFVALASTGAAPSAKQIGVINRFVLLGDIDDGTAYPYGVQWCAINDPTNWPTPASIAARTVQSGRQLLNSSYGAVTAIANGQFYGLVFQRRAITRFTYIGGDTVFQVETFERARGCWAPESMCQIGNMCRFMANDGWYETDGQSVRPIGNGKVDAWFFAALNQANLTRISHGVDWESKCILWSFPTASASAGTNDRMLIYNFVRDRFSWAEATADLLIESYTQSLSLEDLDALYASLDAVPVSLDSPLFQGGVPGVAGFTGSAFGFFTGAKAACTLETGELDGNPFGRVFVRGVRPLITGSPTSVTVSLSLRDTQDNAGQSFGTAVSRTTRTGVCDFRSQGRFIAMRTVITGGFDRALKAEFDVEEGDQV